MRPPSNLRRRSVPQRVHNQRPPQGLPPVTDAMFSDPGTMRDFLQAVHDALEEMRQQNAFLLNLSDQELKRYEAFVKANI